MLAGAAGIVGSLLAREFAVRISRLVLPDIGPENVPVWFDFNPSLNTVLCLAGLVVVAAAIAGGIPGVRVTGRWRSGLHALGERDTRVGLVRTRTDLLATQVAVSIFGRSLVPLVIGAGAGCLVALLIDSSVQTEEVGGQGIPGIVPAAAVVMILVGVLALAGPARRAVRIDPAQALRTN